jgi:hypothetical protein
MAISDAERRQIENEMIFRRINEKVGTDLKELDAKHVEDGHYDLVQSVSLELHFKCECSDENCSVRIPMLLTEYKEIHADRDTFIVKPNHQVDPIEKVIKATPNYNVVKKNNSTSEPSDTLNITTIDNS